MLKNTHIKIFKLNELKVNVEISDFDSHLDVQKCILW